MGPYTPHRTDLENNGCPPDILVENGPEEFLAGQTASSSAPCRSCSAACGDLPKEPG